MNIPKMNVPLNLTSSQQSLLAEICRLVSDVVRTNDDWSDVPPVEAVKVVDQILEVVERFDASSQTFGILYDKLHRTGANA